MFCIGLLNNPPSPIVNLVLRSVVSWSTPWNIAGAKFGNNTSAPDLEIGLITLTQTREQAIEYLEELSFLAHTAGADPVKYFLQKLSYADPKTFIGKGKLVEVKEFILENDIGLVIFDDELWK